MSEKDRNNKPIGNSKSLVNENRTGEVNINDVEIKVSNSNEPQNQQNLIHNSQFSSRASIPNDEYDQM